jgi:hypothetical protein
VDATSTLEAIQPTSQLVTIDVWRASAAIAAWRVSVSDKIRQPDRDRGADKNRLNDIQRVIGELAGILALEQVVPNPPHIIHDLLDLSGPVNDVDIVATLRAGDKLRLETKCHLDVAHKKLLLINLREHEKSGARGSCAYVPVLGKLGRACLLVGRPIPHEDVDAWKIERFRDKARSIRLEDLCTAYLQKSWRDVRVLVDSSREVCAPETLFAIFARAYGTKPPDISWRDLDVHDLVRYVCASLPFGQQPHWDHHRERHTARPSPLGRTDWMP